MDRSTRTLSRASLPVSLCALGLVLAGGVAQSAWAQPCPAVPYGWSQLRPFAGIPARAATAVAASGDGSTVVLFGGSSGGTIYCDTWVRTLTGWELRSVPGPSARTGHTLAYDPVRQRTVLYGGVGSEGVLSDTWEWDGASWTQLSPSETPGPRTEGVLVYGGPSVGVILVGGANASDGVAVSETWAWDGTSWSNLGQLGITRRLLPGAAYDAGRQRAVVYGGLNPTTFDQRADTWEFDGVSWTPVDSFGAPGGRESAGMAYDAGRGTIVLRGGLGADGRTFELTGGFWQEIASEGPQTALPLAYHGGLGRVIQLEAEPSRTWAWDGAAWTVTGSVLIPALNAHAVARDPGSGRVAVFGGTTFLGGKLGALWTLGSSGWELASETGPAARDRAGLVADTQRGRLVLFGGSDANGDALGDTWVWSGGAWTELAGAALTGRSGFAAAYDATRDRVVVFGGRDADFNTVGETWTFDGASWSQVITSTNPVARTRSAMTYDPSRGKVVLFGGRDENFTPLNDLWEFDGADWAQVAAATAPAGRAAATLSYDSASNRLVLVGGQDGDFNTLDETWTFTNAAGWQRLGGTTLGARSDHGAAFDPALGRVVVFGGYNGLDTVGDTWSFVGGLNLAVTAQPASVTTCPGSTVSFAVSAAGGNGGSLSYQWRVGGVPIDAAGNASAATATLVLSGVSEANGGVYDVVVTSACGSVISAGARLAFAAKCSLADVAGTLGGGTQCGDSTVDGSDFVAFINSFAIGDVAIDPLADVAGGGDEGLSPDGTIDGTDFVAFINAFALGC